MIYIHISKKHLWIDSTVCQIRKLAMNNVKNFVWKRLILIFASVLHGKHDFVRVSEICQKLLFLFKMLPSLSYSKEQFILTLCEWNVIYFSHLCTFTTQPLSVEYCNIWQLQFLIKPSHIHIFHSMWRLYVFIWQTRKLVLVLPQQDSSPHFFPLQL